MTVPACRLAHGSVWHARTFCVKWHVGSILTACSAFPLWGSLVTSNLSLAF